MAGVNLHTNQEHSGKRTGEMPFEKGHKQSVKHGLYRNPDKLEPETREKVVALREELERADRPTIRRHLAHSAALRASLLREAHEWLAKVPTFWLEDQQVRYQGLLQVIGSMHEGLRRDLERLWNMQDATEAQDIGVLMARAQEVRSSEATD